MQPPAQRFTPALRALPVGAHFIGVGASALSAVLCAGCGNSFAHKRESAASSPAASASARVESLRVLAVLPRPKPPPGRLTIELVSDGSEVDAASATPLRVSVSAPFPIDMTTVALELSLDGARPRPLVRGSATLAELHDPDAALAPGGHDLVAALLNRDGLALDPDKGGVATLRFFVGPGEKGAARARLVCLRPFGTYYGREADRLPLDFLVVGGRPSDARVTVVGPAAPEPARAVGPGPFVLGDFESGDYEVTLEPIAGTGDVIPGRCVFTVNRELERTP